MPNHSDKPKRGRPPTYKFLKPDSELSENEKRLKESVLKRRQRQNRSYQEKRMRRQMEKTKSASSHSSRSASSSSFPSLPSTSPPAWTPAPVHGAPAPQVSLSTARILDKHVPIPDELLRLGQLVHEDLKRSHQPNSAFFSESRHGFK
ncbi:unnamed protein product [Agarophyton chilense]